MKQNWKKLTVSRLSLVFLNPLDPMWRPSMRALRALRALRPHAGLLPLGGAGELGICTTQNGGKECSCMLISVPWCFYLSTYIYIYIYIDRQYIKCICICIYTYTYLRSIPINVYQLWCTYNMARGQDKLTETDSWWISQSPSCLRDLKNETKWWVEIVCIACLHGIHHGPYDYVNSLIIYQSHGKWPVEIDVSWWFTSLNWDSPVRSIE